MAYTNRWQVRFEAEDKEVAGVPVKEIWFTVEVTAGVASEAVGNALAVLDAFGQPLHDMMTLTLLERIEE